MHRIPPLPYSKTHPRQQPVILQHGLTGTSSNFVMASAEVPLDHSVIGYNMAFELAKRGFDVWLSNNRGNEYAMRHVHLSAEDPQFWNFTFDEMSRYDLPSVIDYVRSFTKHGKSCWSSCIELELKLYLIRSSFIHWPLTRFGSDVCRTKSWTTG